jgi:hypothetical protein
MIDSVDAACMRDFQYDLAGMTLREAESALEYAQEKIDEETAWAVALAAFVRNSGELPKDL